MTSEKTLEANFVGNSDSENDNENDEFDVSEQFLTPYSEVKTHCCICGDKLKSSFNTTINEWVIYLF